MPRGLHSPPGERDRDQKWSDLGSVAHFRSFPSSFLPFLFCFLLGLRSEVTDQPPSPPLLSPSFRVTSSPSDRGLSTHLSISSKRRDRLRPWMTGGHQVWGLLPVRLYITPIFGVDSLKLFLKSPYHTRIAWHLLPCQTRFDLMVSLDGISTPNLLLLRTSIVVLALVLLWTVTKLCVDRCYFGCTVCVCCCCCSGICCCNICVVCCCCSIGVVLLLLLCSYCPLGRVFAVTPCHLGCLLDRVFTVTSCHFCCPHCRVLYPSE